MKKIIKYFINNFFILLNNKMDFNTLVIVIITSCIISLIYIFIFLKFISKGKDGKDGKDGTCPTNCKDGKDGKDGSCPQNCVNGSNGRNGTDGPTGPQGPTGPTGPQGPKGDPGTPASPSIPQDLKLNSLQLGNTKISEQDLRKLTTNTFPGLNVNGDIQMNGTSGYPIRIKPATGAGSSLITFYPGKSFGLDGNNTPWSGPYPGWYL